MAVKSLSPKELEALLGTLRGVFDAVLAEAGQNPKLALQLSSVLGGAKSASARHRPVLDPFAVYEQGWEAMLRSRLGSLSSDQLADIIRAYKLDPAGRTRDQRSEKLRDWIIEAVEHRNN